MNRPVRMQDLDPETRARMIARRSEVRQTCTNLLNVVADRIPAETLDMLREFLFVGEEAELMDLLVAVLVKKRIPLTPNEADLVQSSLETLGAPPSPSYRFLDDRDGVLARLTVISADGVHLSPPPDLDIEDWKPRRRAASLWGRVGGHLRGTGIPHKTTFPANWDAEKINAMTLDVARNPDEVPEQDRNGGWITRGTRENVRIEVRLLPVGTIVTGYPVYGLGVLRNGPDGDPTEVQW